MLELMCAFTSLSKFFMMVDVKSHMMVLIRHSTLLFFGTGLLEEGWDFRMEEWEVKRFLQISLPADPHWSWGCGQGHYLDQLLSVDGLKCEARGRGIWWRRISGRNVGEIGVYLSEQQETGGKGDVFVSSFPFSVHLIFLINLMLLPFVTTLWQFGHYSDLLVFSKLKKLTYGHL